MSERLHTRTSRETAGGGRLVDRRQTFTFSFEGKAIAAHPGDTIGSALARAGVSAISRSFKYHRPRGLLCCAGHCPNCLVQVEQEPNVRACTRPAQEGMTVVAQNAWPSLKRDVMSLTALGDRFLPVGFYYKTFIRPRALWPLYEWVLRHAAGLGRVDPQTAPATYDKQYLHADVAVVGGGPAGLSAAAAAAQQGARVLLFDENLEFGGHTRYSESGDHESGEWGRATANLQSLISSLQSPVSNLHLYPNTTVLGYYQHNWLSAVCGNRLFKIRARTVIVATGAYEQPLLFANNDLPGVMLGSGVQRLLHLYGVLPGATAVVLTSNDEGWQVARDLLRAGAAVAAVVDRRSAGPSAQAAPLSQALQAAGARVFLGSAILAAAGNGAVQEAVIAPLDERARAGAGSETRLPCDLIAVSGGWAPANGLLNEAGADISYQEHRGQFIPHTLPSGIYAAGRVIGEESLQVQLEQGRRAGRAAAAYAMNGASAGDGQGTTLPLPPEVAEEAATGAPAAAPTVIAGDARAQHGKRFVCFCEDVTDKDVQTAIDEGYDDIELLKRYSTISMGPCQGKMCAVSTIHLCARANGRSVAETGTTTARPPTTPVPLGVLAGQHMEPVKVTPLDDWHRRHGAHMMVAGLWLRPEHYGDPLAEVQAVRQHVGLVDVSTLGKLRLSGPGIPRLLDRLYVNRWQKLAPGRVRYGVMCNDEGIVLDDGVTACLGPEEYYMTVTSSGAGAIYEWIQWWVQSGWGDGVQVTPLTDDYAAFNLAGPQSRSTLSRLVEEDVSNDGFPYMHVRQMDVAGVACRLLRIGFTGELSYEIHCPAGYAQDLWQALIDAGAGHDIRPFGLEAQRVLRLEKAHIIVGQDTDALSDPFAAGMAWAVKLDKPDFLGRRSLARISEEGAASSLAGFKMDRPHLVPEEGLQIVEADGEHGQRIIGHVTSSRFSPTLQQAIGLCWLPTPMVVAGQPFTIRLEDGRLAQARVHLGAFYDAQGDRLRM